jgi:hypothetical protein
MSSKNHEENANDLNLDLPIISHRSHVAYSNRSECKVQNHTKSPSTFYPHTSDTHASFYKQLQFQVCKPREWQWWGPPITFSMNNVQTSIKKQNPCQISSNPLSSYFINYSTFNNQHSLEKTYKFI